MTFKRLLAAACVAIACWAMSGTPARAADSEADAARLKEDVALYADTTACGEEPLADRLRAAVLLAEVDRGRSAQHIRELRQAFLDGWRDRARQGEPSASACRAMVDRAQARVDALRR